MFGEAILESRRPAMIIVLVVALVFVGIGYACHSANDKTTQQFAHDFPLPNGTELWHATDGSVIFRMVTVEYKTGTRIYVSDNETEPFGVSRFVYDVPVRVFVTIPPDAGYRVNGDKITLTEQRGTAVVNIPSYPDPVSWAGSGGEWTLHPRVISTVFSKG